MRVRVRTCALASMGACALARLRMCARVRVRVRVRTRTRWRTGAVARSAPLHACALARFARLRALRACTPARFASLCACAPARFALLHTPPVCERVVIFRGAPKPLKIRKLRRQIDTVPCSRFNIKNGFSGLRTGGTRPAPENATVSRLGALGPQTKQTAADIRPKVVQA